MVEKQQMEETNPKSVSSEVDAEKGDTERIAELERLVRGLEDYSKSKDERIAELESELEYVRDPERKEEMERLANHDELTGLLNRRGFKRVAERLMIDVAKKNMPTEPNRRESEQDQEQRQFDFSIIFLDVDDFKRFNDTYGHKAGDAALKFVANIIDGVLRGPDIVGRWGGEEFIAAIETKDPGGRFVVAERVRKAIHETPFVFEDKELFLTVSIGVAKHKAQEDFHELIDRSDKAMYRAKTTGKNKVVIPEDEE